MDSTVFLILILISIYLKGNSMYYRSLLALVWEHAVGSLQYRKDM